MTMPAFDAVDQRPRHPVGEPVCRLCGARLHRTLIDLGCLPLANRTVAAGSPDAPVYPLHARICDDCRLVQVSDVAPAAAVAAPVAYLSSCSAVRVRQAGRYAAMMRRSLRLDGHSLVIEVGSNDGYLLRHFHVAGIPVLGIDPARNAAAAAAQLGIETEVDTLTTETAMAIAVRRGRADLLVANNVLPHVPDLFDFLAGCACLLRPHGIVSLQVPHLLPLLQRAQFDAFRHDSYSYLSLHVLERVLRSVGLRVFDAEREPDHGGSLRIYGCHAINPLSTRPGLKSVRLEEALTEAAWDELCAGFSDRVATVCAGIRAFVQGRRAEGRRLAAYGAAVRGSTLLNACGMGTDLISCVADPDPAKHGRCLPGSGIPIVPLEALLAQPPSDILILPWTSVADAVEGLQPLKQLHTQHWTLMPLIARV